MGNFAISKILAAHTSSDHNLRPNLTVDVKITEDNDLKSANSNFYFQKWNQGYNRKESIRQYSWNIRRKKTPNMVYFVYLMFFLFFVCIFYSWKPLKRTNLILFVQKNYGGFNKKVRKWENKKMKSVLTNFIWQKYSLF